jgi:hypothetical protein
MTMVPVVELGRALIQPSGFPSGYMVLSMAKRKSLPVATGSQRH